MKKIYTLITALLTGFGAFAQIPTNGLVAKYSFNDSTNLVTDNHTGTYPLTGSTTVTSSADGFTNSPSNKSAEFTGATTSALSVNNAAFRTPCFTISAWFKVSAFQSYNTIVSTRYNPTGPYYNSFNLHTGNSTAAGKKLRLTYRPIGTNEKTITGTTVLEEGVWYHAVAVYDSLYGRAQIFLNGSLEASYTYAFGNGIAYITDQDRPFVIGNVNPAANGNGFMGKIDEVLFYNRGLSDLEVLNLWHSYSSPGMPTTGLVAKYSFIGLNGIKIDNSGNLNNVLTNGGTVSSGNGYQNLANSSATFAGDGNSILSSESYAFRTTSVSMATWIKPMNFNPNNTIAAIRYNASGAPYNSINLSTGTNVSKKVSFTYYTAGSTSEKNIQGTTVLQTGTWYHVAATYDETTGIAKLYVNGNLEATSTTGSPGAILYNDKPFVMGNIPNVNNHGLVGMIDEFLYYSRALSANEICGIYSGASCTPTATAAAHTAPRLEVYPNPAQNVLNVKNVAKGATLQILDMTGKVLQSSFATNLNTSALADGLYLLRVISAEGTQTQKFMITR
ncbi:Por secretion system C-terminal sorting domain-containing protein [Flexibacter flexilis DSM 6793]|uniref:Por secretion system C-terminal sorting domain-containing protein n=1 Tax=Flexibacter flexilis DSM 6793 TaxID=927664 RepID=A0A1I1FBE1_9BACT|nr:LamG-like jellyroll fold domain-containing protein [Flexibacter flexilis]SFB96727.1 Por secretion system C-terminal sorting domain-containing protein [Flexibacter flexilis DSM 6793]